MRRYKSLRNLNKGVVARQALAIAIIYAGVTVIMSYLRLANPDYQCRVSEAMCVLPYYLPAAVPGLFVGCIVGNLAGGCAMLDIIVGSLTTLVAAIITALIRKHSIWLAPLPALILNTLVIPCILPFCDPSQFVVEHIWKYMIRVGAGEFISCYILGMVVIFIIRHNERSFFK